ncbi:MAG: hypothetical protein HY976_01080 [Candidatus Kerfeldbacteria bacterium]|nr:hypothetical protein [Candidatus Kerfeldbacteria bacterium]
MALTQEHVTAVCRFGEGALACKYVSPRTDGGFICRKIDPTWKRLLEIRSSNGEISAKGDNCEGRSA